MMRFPAKFAEALEWRESCHRLHSKFVQSATPQVRHAAAVKNAVIRLPVLRVSSVGERNHPSMRW